MYQPGQNKEKAAFALTSGSQRICTLSELDRHFMRPIWLRSATPPCKSWQRLQVTQDLKKICPKESNSPLRGCLQLPKA